MAASDALKTKLYRLLEQAGLNPVTVDFGQIMETVKEVRAGGTACKTLHSRLGPKTLAGYKLAKAFDEARLAAHPELPPLNLMGKTGVDDLEYEKAVRADEEAARQKRRVKDAEAREEDYFRLRVATFNANGRR